MKNYTLKGLKTFTGNEGTGFSANLYHGNRKVAEILDDAWGGPLQLFWRAARQEEEQFKEWARDPSRDTHHTREDGSGFTIEYDWEFWASDAVEQVLLRQDAMKALRKPIGLQDGKLYSWNGVYNQPWSKMPLEHKVKLRQHCDNKGIVLLNRLPKEDAIKQIIEVIK